jgi:hypothetical protein
LPSFGVGAIPAVVWFLVTDGMKLLGSRARFHPAPATCHRRRGLAVEKPARPHCGDATRRHIGHDAATRHLAEATHA